MGLTFDDDGRFITAQVKLMRLLQPAYAYINAKISPHRDARVTELASGNMLKVAACVGIAYRADALEIRGFRRNHTRIGISTYSAFDLSFSRSRVGAAASARWTSMLSPSI